MDFLHSLCGSRVKSFDLLGAYCAEHLFHIQFDIAHNCLIIGCFVFHYYDPHAAL